MLVFDTRFEREFSKLRKNFGISIFFRLKPRLKMSVLRSKGNIVEADGKRIREALTSGDSRVDLSASPQSSLAAQRLGSSCCSINKPPNLPAHVNTAPPRCLHALIETNIPEIRFMSFHNERLGMIIVGEAAGDAGAPDLVLIKRWLHTSFLSFLCHFIQ